MRGFGHQVTGLAVGLAAAPLLLDGLAAQLFVVVSAWVGGTAPDWLEIPFTKNGGRVSVVPHRRITHWALLWLCALGATLLLLQEHFIYPFAAGFALGGVTHLALDVPNPAGIPLLHPWKRVSLHLWRSGEHEGLIMGVFLFTAWTLFLKFSPPS